MPAGTNCIILTATLRIKKQMWLVFSFYVLFSFLVFRVFNYNCKQWPEYQQYWANHCLRIDGLEYLDTFSLIDVYERLIHDANQ